MPLLTGSNTRRATLRRLKPQPAKMLEEGEHDDLARGILTTEISPGRARVMTAAFLAAIVALPVIQGAIELVRGGQIQALSVFRSVPTRANLDQFERDLNKSSIAQQAVQPWLQLNLSSELGFGTTNVILGRDGWLFYRPGIDWLTGPGLLDATRLAVRKQQLIDAGETNPSPDPRPAIVAFHESCRAAGVHLVVIPVPDKATLQAALLSSRFDARQAGEMPVNVDYQRLLDELRSSGVDVFDPTPKYVEEDEPRFLRQDTHWTPEWMETVARGLAGHLRTQVPALRTEQQTWTTEEWRVSRTGDLVEMLKLPPGQKLYPPQTVTVHRVLNAWDGQAWEARAEADVLLLGDSFSNIYCTRDLGWGDAAGFPAHLARFLGGDVDVIARNGSGASATRRELARRSDPLKGKKVVLWEFAARELMTANWDVVPLPANRPGAPSEGSAQTPGEGVAALVLEGTIVAASHVPPPLSVPYKDCLTYVKLKVDRVLEGSPNDDHVIAVFWGMKENVRLPPADYGAGKRLRLSLTPLRKAPVTLQTVRSADDLDDYERRPYYVLEERAP